MIVFGALRGLETFVQIAEQGSTYTPGLDAEVPAELRSFLRDGMDVSRINLLVSFGKFYLFTSECACLCRVLFSQMNLMDAPRFQYRGLMMDLSRHFYPVDFILHTIDAMSYSKLNILRKYPGQF